MEVKAPHLARLVITNDPHGLRVESQDEDGRLWQTDGWWLCKRNQREPTLKRELLVEFRVYGEVWSLTEIVYSVWVEKRFFSGIRVFFSPPQSRSTGHHFWALITSECFLVLSRRWVSQTLRRMLQWWFRAVTRCQCYCAMSISRTVKHVKHVKHVKRVWLKSAEWLSKLKVLRKKSSTSEVSQVAKDR